jgi:outer membrane protein TolC
MNAMGPWRAVLGMLFALVASAPRASRADEGSASAPVTVTLRDVLRGAQRDPPAVRAALAALVRADAQRSSAQLAYLPSLVGQANGGISYDNQLVVPGAPRIDSESLTAQASASIDWAILDLSRAARVDAARSDARAQRFAAEDAQRASMQASAELYVRALAAVALVDDATLTLERRTTLARGVHDLVRTGVHPPVDGARADVELANAKHALIARQIEARAALRALSAAVGGDPAAPLSPQGDDTSILEVSLPARRAKEEADANRPEVQQSTAALTARRADYDAAVDARLPTFGVSATGSASYAQVNSGIGIDGAVYSASAVAYLRWNALDPVVWGRAAPAEAASEEAKQERDRIILSVEAEAVAASFAAEAAKNDLDLAMAVLGAAGAVREAQTERYRAGVASLVELVDAESLDQQARIGRILARRDYLTAGARLLSACGLLARLARLAR